MSTFSVQAQDGPTIRKISTGKLSESAQSSRDRAIQRLLGQNPDAQAPVANPNSVAPEEMAVVRPQSVQSDPATAAEPQGQKYTEEAPQASEAKAPEEPLSSQYALLARKEKALRAKIQAQQAETKAREDALRAKEEALKAKEAEYQNRYIPKDRLTNELPSVLAELGLSADQISQLILEAPKEQDVRTSREITELKATIKSLEEQVKGTTKSFEEQQKQSYDQALNQIRKDVSRLVQVDPSYELVNATNSTEAVVRLIQKTFDERGELLSIEEAAAAVESELLDSQRKIASLSKVKGLYQSAPKAEAPKPQASSPQQPQMKTLTNANSSARRLSARERAIQAFQRK